MQARARQLTPDVDPAFGRELVHAGDGQRHRQGAGGVGGSVAGAEGGHALTPAGARELVQRGHDVLVETSAGDGSWFPDSGSNRNAAKNGIP